MNDLQPHVSSVGMARTKPVKDDDLLSGRLTNNLGPVIYSSLE
jgi:hypothetical protein